MTASTIHWTTQLQAVTLLQHALSFSYTVLSNTPVLPRFILLQPTNYRVSNIPLKYANSHVIGTTPRLFCQYNSRKSLYSL